MTGEARTFEPGPLGPPVTPKVAEERGYALLRALVPEEDWGKTVYYVCCHECGGEIREYINVIGNVTKTKYRIWLAEPIANIEQLTSHKYRRWCAAPGRSNDMIRSVSKNGEVMQYHSALTLRSLPWTDLYLGQYLTIKYNEAEFLDKAK